MRQACRDDGAGVDDDQIEADVDELFSWLDRAPSLPAPPSVAYYSDESEVALEAGKAKL